MTIENAFLVLAILLLASVGASKISTRFGVPGLLLFLAIGMLAGSDGVGGIYFDNALTAQWVGVIALAFILFSGGLDTDWRAVRPVVKSALVLATVGVVLTAAIVAVFAVWALGFSFYEGLLLGAIISSTDAAATFAVLRHRAVRLQEPLEPLLELESGSNDPMAVYLTIAFTALLGTAGTTLWEIVPVFFLQMIVGTVLGLAMGKAMVFVINRARLQQDGLYVVLTMALMLFTYGLTAVLGGSGFLAVYIAGILLGNSEFVHRRSLLRFHDGMAWLMQIALFLVLGLLVFPSQLPGVALAGLMTAAVLMFVARPISVFVSLAFSRLGWRAKLFVSWVGLRGAVPIILATYPLIAGLEKAPLFFNLVFFVVLTSVFLQGTTLTPVARWLRVVVTAPVAPKYPLYFEAGGRTSIKNDLIEIEIGETATASGKEIVSLGLPSGALIVLISRGQDFVVPHGSTILLPGDRLLILAERAQEPELRRSLIGEPASASE
jgi:cell volume regulation protein A